MKVLVSDFDYTFFTLDYLNNIELVRNFVKQGNVFVIATSRNYVQLMEELENFDVPYSILICNDGSVIYDSEKKILLKSHLDPSIVPSLFRLLDKEKGISELYIDTGREYTIHTEEPAMKLIAKIKDYDKIDKIIDAIEKQYTTVRAYLNKGWIHVTNKEATKGNSVSFIADYYGLSNENIYTVGDNTNDISMLERFNSFALAEAPEEVRNVSRRVVSTFSDVIEELEKDA